MADYTFEADGFQFRVRIQELPDPKVSSIDFLDSPKPLSLSLPPLVQRLKESILRVLQGLSADFDLENLNWNLLSEKKQKILKTLAKTRPGDTLSYAQLAQNAGFSKNHARFTGSCMASNPFPLIIPCHRVVREDGSIGNYSGGGPEVKRFLLEKESRG